MLPLERLFGLEIEFHRNLRMLAPRSGDAAGAHTSYALQADYESLLHAIGPVTPYEIERLCERLILAADPRDVLAASDSLKQLLGLPLLDQ
jgi:hypothetical protein